MSAPIRLPRRDELEALVAIERDAVALFATVGMPEIADDDPGSGAELEPFRAGGHAWVAVDDTRGKGERRRATRAPLAPRRPLAPFPR